MRNGHAGEHELLNTLYKNDDLNIGWFKDDDTTVDEARSLMIDRILRLVPKIAKKTKFLVVGSGHGYTPISIVDKHLCRVDAVTTDPSSIKIIEKVVKDKAYEKKLYPLHTEELHNLPTETDNYNVLLSQEVMSYVEDKRRLFVVYHASLMAEGRLVLTDFISDKELSADEVKLFGYEDPSLWTLKNLEKLTDKTGLQRVYTKDFSPEIIGYYKHIRKQVEENQAKVDKKMGKGSAKEHQEIYDKKIKLLEKGKVKWCLFVYQKINV